MQTHARQIDTTKKFKRVGKENDKREREREKTGKTRHTTQRNSTQRTEHLKRNWRHMIVINLISFIFARRLIIFFSPASSCSNNNNIPVRLNSKYNT